MAQILNELTTDIAAIALAAHFKDLLIAALMGFAIGLERELRGKQPSIRTFSMISTGSCLFTLISIEMAAAAVGEHGDPTRIAAQIVSGVGFIGGGVIFKMQSKVEGITTAALIWLTAGLGMAVGIGHSEMALAAVLVGLTFLFFTMCTYRLLGYLRGYAKHPPNSEGNL
jgi:putative Mg2+ transporter-C (MgtC) family protein